MTRPWPSPPSLSLTATAISLCNSNKLLMKNKWSSLKSSKAVKQILHFMSEDNPFESPEISLQAGVPGEQWKLCDKWGHRVSSRQSVWHAVNSPALAGWQVRWENKINSPFSLTKDPPLLMAINPEETLNEVDAESWQGYWKWIERKWKYYAPNWQNRRLSDY